ncbi:spore gernimation protein KB [Clostridium tetani]|nr:spore gernimation protein KB [Clostridium tetani]RXI60165.1 spore gernimation protein KB [Clostridium tetani]RXI61046.1 spore gernimation protein KB [Clostridium tetani]RXI65311.1 spore gernimation protein KB [Clostridium tetani]RXI71041.1 spore gernimation protein KB [Clostridium tetani]
MEEFMKKEVISNKQIQLLIFSYCIGAYLLFSMGAGIKQDIWISSILAIIFTIPIVIMYGKIMNLYPGKNFFDILEEVFGRMVGKVLNIIFIFHAFFLGAYILRDFADFIKVTALFSTPMIVPMICIGILSIWILTEGIEVLAAWAKFLIRIILISMILIWIMLIPEMHISNLQPVFYADLKDILKQALHLITFPFSEVIIFLNFFDYVNYNSKTKNVFIKPLILGGMLVVLYTMINLMLLGGELYSFFYYPGYESIKRLNLGNEFQRLEIIVSIAFTIIQFLEINFCILGVSKGITKVFNLKEYRRVLIPVIILLITFAYVMFGSAMEAFEIVRELWPAYGIVIQIVLPFIIFIFATIKRKNQLVKCNK